MLDRAKRLNVLQNEAVKPLLELEANGYAESQARIDARADIQLKDLKEQLAYFSLALGQGGDAEQSGQEADVPL
jgi:hypothetical protein